MVRGVSQNFQVDEQKTACREHTSDVYNAVFSGPSYEQLWTSTHIWVLVVYSDKPLKLSVSSVAIMKCIQSVEFIWSQKKKEIYDLFEEIPVKTGTATAVKGWLLVLSQHFNRIIFLCVLVLCPPPKSHTNGPWNLNKDLMLMPHRKITINKSKTIRILISQKKV